MSYQQVSIQDRTKKFAVRIVKACIWLEESKVPRMLGNQLLRSGTSIGANCSEAQSAQSRRDFISKYEIALKEARETKYWLEVLIEAELVSLEKFKGLIQETEEIIKILVTTVKKLKE
ncbi:MULTISPECIES: four helix bundle protein [unclassified Moorena]|uniref:four helix bundle protein n=1 Tax=unclassified Moorena TaxID=2683338 RepID=UPI0013C5A4FE|nr:MULTISPECIES: four helix bundle protein [unclassified Moorena]NEO18651.1 four helix bundle protein [Moorena sp. SIO4A5]NEP21654.1 four helix bundle protein [Moorena sp. SIO3I6]